MRTADLSGNPEVRCATVSDARKVAELLCAFNREFGDPAPPADVLAERLVRLLDGGETVVLLVGDGPQGVAVLRFRLALWSSGFDCYLAELYVVPASRGHGLGRALMETALRVAEARGADTMEIGVDEPDVAARNLYESLGFTNRVSDAGDAVMYVYERELSGDNGLDTTW
jgi:ribosomal protein S18 acetylase RimI-like enzyme